MDKSTIGIGESNRALLEGAADGRLPLMLQFALVLNENRFRGDCAAELTPLARRIVSDRHVEGVTARRRYSLADHAVREIIPHLIRCISYNTDSDPSLGLKGVRDKASAIEPVRAIRKRKYYSGEGSDGSCIDSIAELCEMVQGSDNDRRIVDLFMRAFEQSIHSWENAYADEHGYYPPDAQMAKNRQETRDGYLSVLRGLLQSNK